MASININDPRQLYLAQLNDLKVYLNAVPLALSSTIDLMTIIQTCLEQPAFRNLEKEVVPLKDRLKLVRDELVKHDLDGQNLMNFYQILFERFKQTGKAIVVITGKIEQKDKEIRRIQRKIQELDQAMVKGIRPEANIQEECGRLNAEINTIHSEKLTLKYRLGKTKYLYQEIQDAMSTLNNKLGQNNEKNKELLNSHKNEFLEIIHSTIKCYSTIKF